jgi:hypothetical protein
VTIDIRGSVPTRSRMQGYSRVLDLQGASRRGLVYEYARLKSKQKHHQWVALNFDEKKRRNRMRDLSMM